MRARLSTSFLIPLVLLVGAPLSRAQTEDHELKKVTRVTREQCLSEARRRFSHSAAQLEELPTPPKRRRAAVPSVLGSTAVWIGETLIAPDGKVSEVWQVRGVSSEVDAAILKAVRKWEYEPTKVGKEAVPLCLGLTLTLQPRH